MKKKVLVILCVVAMMALMAVPAFAAEVTPITYNDFSSVISGLQEQISVSTIVELLASLVGVTVGLVFMWWGVRKVTKAIMGAFRNGKLSV